MMQDISGCDAADDLSGMKRGIDDSISSSWSIFR